MTSFLLTALAAALLASVSGGIIGSYVVVKRLTNMCGSITHSILGGMGFFLWLQRVHGVSWATPLLGAFASAVLSAWLIGWIQLRFRQRVDAIISAVWSTGMAIGIIFVSLTPGSTAELSHFLLGNILWISPGDLVWLALLNVAILVAVWCFHRPFVTLCFDEEQALLQKIPVQTFYLLLLTLMALAIVLLIQIIGTILTIALLTLPPTTANLFTRRMGSLMTRSVLFSALVSASGVGASYVLDWPPGATIALIAAALYFAALVSSRIKTRKTLKINKIPTNLSAGA